MAWVRQDKIPDTMRFTILIDSAKHPEVANFIWSLPWGKGGDVVREIIYSHIKNGKTAPVGHRAGSSLPVSDVSQTRGNSASAPAVVTSPAARTVSAAPAVLEVKQSTQFQQESEQVIGEKESAIIEDQSAKFR